MTAPLSVFISYAHEDEPALKRLTNHLSSLQREGLITGWYDRMTTAGGDWEREIKARLEAADIVVLLVSSDFTASDYCVGVEATLAVERWKANKTRIIPVIVRAVDWKKFPIGSGASQTSLGLLNALPQDGQPIQQWDHQDEAYLNVAAGLRAVIEDINRVRMPAPGPDGANISTAPEATAPVTMSAGAGTAAPATTSTIGAARNPTTVAVHRLMPFVENDSVTWFIGPAANGSAPEVSIRTCDMARTMLADLQLVEKDWTRLLLPVDVAASYYAAKRGMTTLLQDVSSWIGNESQIPASHQALALVLSLIQSKRRKPKPAQPAARTMRSNKQLIVTTNIDLMMERALVAAGLPFTRIVQVHSEPRLEIMDCRELSRTDAGHVTLATTTESGKPTVVTANPVSIESLDALLASAPNHPITLDSAIGVHTNNQNALESLSIKEFADPILFKLRGSIDVPESYAMSAEQYLDFCLNMACRFVPTQIGTIVQNTPAVFLGYGYLDPDFRLLYYTFLRALTEFRKEDRKLYFVQARPFADTDDNYRWMEVPIWDDLKDSGPRRAQITTIEESPLGFVEGVALALDPTVETRLPGRQRPIASQQV